MFNCFGEEGQMLRHCGDRCLRSPTATENSKAAPDFGCPSWRPVLAEADTWTEAPAFRERGYRECAFQSRNRGREPNMVQRNPVMIGVRHSAPPSARCYTQADRRDFVQTHGWLQPGTANPRVEPIALRLALPRTLAFGAIEPLRGHTRTRKDAPFETFLRSINSPAGRGFQPWKFRLQPSTRSP